MLTEKGDRQIMELGGQIKRYRNEHNLSQEELAEKIFVSRQTISNWENGKSYPDIHSLLLLSNLFGISLDQLIKGDVEIMREEIKEVDLQKFNREAGIFSVLLIGTVVSCVPLAKFFGIYGLVAWGILWMITMIYAFKIEKYKKEHDVQSYKEIVAFMEGKRLDEIEKKQEIAKRPYQKVLLVLGSAVVGFVVAVVMVMLVKML